MSKLHDNHRELLRSFAQTTIHNAEKTISEAESVEDHKCRISCAYLEKHLRKLKYMAYKRSDWSKYGSLGLFSGIYGMLCLFFIGLFGCQHEPFAQRYLLVMAEFFIFAEILICVRGNMEEDTNIARVGAYGNLFLLTVLIIVGAILAYFDWTFKVFPEFETPFIASLVIIYLPFLVFLFNILSERCKVLWIMKSCSRKIAKIQQCLKQASATSSSETDD